MSPASNKEPDAPHPTTNANQVPEGLYAALKDEVTHEVRHIENNKEPVDTSQSDVLVQKHVTGLAISFFVLIAIVLLAAIAGIALYAHNQRSVPHPGMAYAAPLSVTRHVDRIAGERRNPASELVFPEVHRTSYR